eukprot:GFYU01000306.1.p1 GENE.GFYU01000306.1~~GFYU01000306.1.p1  ORF type:complete len:336 (-),score=61.09 GFYU01000306.1:145-1152(-)
MGSRIYFPIVCDPIPTECSGSPPFLPFETFQPVSFSNRRHSSSPHKSKNKMPEITVFEIEKLGKKVSYDVKSEDDDEIIKISQFLRYNFLALMANLFWSFLFFWMLVTTVAVPIFMVLWSVFYYFALFRLVPKALVHRARGFAEQKYCGCGTNLGLYRLGKCTVILLLVITFIVELATTFRWQPWRIITALWTLVFAYLELRCVILAPKVNQIILTNVQIQQADPEYAVSMPRDPPPPAVQNPAGDMAIASAPAGPAQNGLYPVIPTPYATGLYTTPRSLATVAPDPYAAAPPPSYTEVASKAAPVTDTNTNTADAIPVAKGEDVKVELDKDDSV